MLKKLLYNKYKVLNIPENLPYTSEEIFKVLYDKKNAIMFKYKDELRLLAYSGFDIDFLGRATKFQPLPIASSENYKTLNADEVVKYEENALRGSFSSYSYVSEDIENYICILKQLDDAIIINSKQVFLPFVAKTTSQNQGQMLRKILQDIFGENYKNIVIDTKITDANNGTIIETTNMQLFVQTLQDTKKKVLEESFLYLGVGSPAGKLAHESIEEVAENEKVTDLLDNVMYDKFVDFFNRCNEKFGCNMQVVKRF